MLAIILMMLGTTTKKQLLTIKINLGTTTMLEQLTIKMLLGTKRMLELVTCHQGSCLLPSAFADADTPLCPQALNNKLKSLKKYEM